MLLILVLLVLAKAELTLYAQSAQNIRITNQAAADILAGDFEVSDFPGGTDLDIVANLPQTLIDQLEPDSMQAMLLELRTYGNRNTGSDTVSATNGIGAARRWVHDRLADFSARSGGRLQVGYVAFDQLVCDMTAHRNVIGVLPGTGPHADEFIVVEGHLDSRCAERCDIDCPAEGMEDNGSGTALVMELARVMSQYRLDRSVVFMLTTGEEQGLVGAAAFADYCLANNLKVAAVLNNDVIGGVICGQTASPPGCPGLNDIDSINVRIYSSQSVRNLARYTKLAYNERVAPLLASPSIINIMSVEDRFGRGGDHIPFRENGYNAIRFTSANEHGDADASDPAYMDRQHTSEDVLGLDTNNDGALDSFFVDFRYLYRNAIINGEALGLLSTAPQGPQRVDADILDSRVAIAIEDSQQRDSFLLAIRIDNNTDWDTLLRVAAIDTLTLDVDLYYLSAAWVDDRGIPSQWTFEERARVRVSSTGELVAPVRDLELLPNVPNPFDDATTFRVEVNTTRAPAQGLIVVRDVQGRVLSELPISLAPGIQEVRYAFASHDYVEGNYSYSLVVNGEVVDTKWMVYAY